MSVMSPFTSALPAVPVKLTGWVVPWLALIVVTGVVATPLIWTAFVPIWAVVVETATPAMSVISPLTNAAPPTPVKLMGWVVPWLALMVATLAVETLLMFLALISGTPAVEGTLTAVP